MLAQSNNATETDYSSRDRQGKVAFYVLLWKRKGISLELFDNYWKDVHGPVCARLPGQHQYWQYHVAHNEGGFFPSIQGLNNSSDAEDNFDGIAELTFSSEAERQTWFEATGILMDDERNLFRKAIGYNSSPFNSITYLDRIDDGAPNGEVGVIKFHVMVQKADGITTEAFRQYLKQSFAPQVSKSDAVVKFRLHLFEEVDNSRADAAGVSHYEPVEKQYHAAYEIAFSNHLEREKFFTSFEYAAAIKDAAKYIKQIQPFPERTAYTFVYDGKMTLAGQRSAKVANLISKIGAVNQLKDNIVSLWSGGDRNYPKNTDLTSNQGTFNSSLGNLLQGVQHVGVTVSDMAKSLEFYTEVLGGKLVVEENELVGDDIQNILFQKEELDANTQGIDSNLIDIPRLRSGKEDALDVKYISFGNTVVELMYFREAGNPNVAHSSIGSNPSHVGHVNAMHISFNVKEGVDLNLFALRLEEESHKRGMTNVVANRIVTVKSEAERKAIALKYNSCKFPNHQDSGATGVSKTNWDNHPMEGWSLFYCKGPNGEQIEFNQVTRKVKKSFQKAVETYNQSNGTSLTFPGESVSQISQISQISQNIQGNNIVPNGDKTSTSKETVTRNNTETEKKSGRNIDLVKRLFSREEAFDSEGFITLFTDTAVYQFGNFDVCLDKQSIKKSADKFFSQIDAVHHEIKMMSEVEDLVFVEMDVFYWRKDGSSISLPCTGIFRVEGDKFSELRIFMDINPVFDPTISVPKSASVMTVSQGNIDQPPDTMRKHFGEYTEAKQRIAERYVTKWSISGSRWSIESETQAQPSKIQAVGELARAIMAQDWDKVKNLFRSDIFYKVGFSQARYGLQVVVDFFKDTFKNIAVFTGHQVGKVW